VSTPLDVFVAFLADPTFGIPMIVLVAGAIGWVLWSRPSAPPAFVPYRYRRAWMDTAEAGVSTALARGQFRAAVTFLYGRLLALLAEVHRVKSEEFHSMLRFWRRRHVPVSPVERTVLDEFRDVYRRLAAAEGPSAEGFWVAILRASRHRKLRAALGRLLPNYEQLTKSLEAPP
jgi:hypothetical protein